MGFGALAVVLLYHLLFQLEPERDITDAERPE